MTTQNLATHKALSQDPNGPPYVVTGSLDYAGALAIARSAHPKRVLANTNGYRYGRFDELAEDVVDVIMMGQHIARFTPEGVRLWSRGYVTQTTTQALSVLVTGGYFYALNRKIYFERYASKSGSHHNGYARDRDEFTEGTLFPYQIRQEES